MIAPKMSDFAMVGSFLGFVIGMAARPLGAFFFGLEGDCRGAKQCLLRSGYLMGVVTSIIAVVPGYDILGAGTPSLNIFLRLLQGFAIGGTYSSIALLAYDAAPENSKGRFTCFIQVAAPAGYLSSLAAVLVVKIFLGDVAFHAWGWRVCFIAAVALLYFIRKIQLTNCEFELQPLFSTRMEVLKSVVNSFKTRKSFAKAFFFFILPVTGVVGLTTFMGNVYQLFFMQTLLKVDPILSKFILALSSLIYLPTFFFWGVLSDRMNKTKMILIGISLSTVFILPYFMLAEYVGESLKNQGTLIGLHTWLMIIFGSAISTIVVAAYAPLISFLGELLPQAYRNFLLANAYHFGFGLLGSVAQLMGTFFLLERTSLYGTIITTTILSALGIVTILLYLWRNQNSHIRGMKEN
ncbi:MFS transporter [Bdellovibrio sp. HCB2-146]|uniref:MFS transporter n=1 Tax=Bdellovibrio sp. HCB2-146 TaxID=3394362 RepID=UPI0039BD1BD7